MTLSYYRQMYEPGLSTTIKDSVHWYKKLTIQSQRTQSSFQNDKQIGIYQPTTF